MHEFCTHFVSIDYRHLTTGSTSCLIKSKLLYLSATQGDEGAKGEAGKDGDDGKRGNQGTPGPKGTQGETGPPGLAGRDGGVGLPGKPGPLVRVFVFISFVSISDQLKVYLFFK